MAGRHLQLLAMALALGLGVAMPAIGQEPHSPVSVVIQNPFPDALTMSVVKEVESRIAASTRFTMAAARPGQPTLHFILSKAAAIQKNGAGVDVLVVEHQTRWADGGKGSKGFQLCKADDIASCAALDPLDSAVTDRSKMLKSN